MYACIWQLPHGTYIDVQLNAQQRMGGSTYLPTEYVLYAHACQLMIHLISGYYIKRLVCFATRKRKSISQYLIAQYMVPSS